MHKLYQLLLKTLVDLELRGAAFDKHARAPLGIQYVQILGTDVVTRTIKQIAVYTGYVVDKAREDGVLSDQRLSLRNFGDSLMATAHKTTKLGPICYGGGKKGPSNEKNIKNHYWYRECQIDAWSIPATSSSEKVKRQLKFKEQMKETSKVIYIFSQA